MSIQQLEDLVARVRSGVVHLIIHKDKERLSSGTGFFISDKLVTNYHMVCEIPADARLAVRFHDTAPAHADHSFSSYQIQRATCGSSDEDAYDYAILDLPELLEHRPFQFRFANHDAQIGQSVAFLGYLRKHWHLTCGAGIVSATYPRNPATLLEFDAMVGATHSGGPLFDERGDVLGILTRPATGLTNAFDDLLKTFDDAISVLSGTSFFATTSQAMISIQRQMQEVTRQLQSSTSERSGLAIACDNIKNEGIWRSTA